MQAIWETTRQRARILKKGGGGVQELGHKTVWRDTTGKWWWQAQLGRTLMRGEATSQRKAKQAAARGLTTLVRFLPEN